MEYREALNKIEAFCASSERSPKAVEERLEKMDLEYSEVAQIMSELFSANFLNEQRYATAYARDKFRFNRWGKTKIAYMLRSEGISADAIEQALEAIDDEEYLPQLTEILKAKRRQLKDKDPYVLRSKIYRHALSKGYESDAIEKAYKSI